MKKYLLVVLGIFIFMIMPKTVFALSTSGNATVARAAVMDTSNNYYYTAWTSLSSNSLNSVPIPTSQGNYYHMGSEYVISVTLNGETTFNGHVRIPVVSNTIYNYQLMNGLNQDDFKFGFHQNFGVYNITLSNWSYNWECQTYPHLGVAHNYCYYDADFEFTLSEPLTGGYNFNFAVLNTNGIHSSYYYSGYDSNGNAIEFPVSAQNSDYANLAPSVRLNGSSGSGSSDTDTEEIIGSITDSTEQLQETITESYENLVKSQEVCNDYDKNSIHTTGFLTSNGGINSNTGFGITDYILINSSTIEILNIGSNSVYSCFYNVNKELISCFNTNGLTSFTIPPNSYYARFSINKTYNNPSFRICKNGNQALYDGITNPDSSESSSIASDLIEDFELQDRGLTGLIASLLDFVNDIFDSTCSPIELTIPFTDTDFSLPCMSTIYTTYAPNLFTLYQLITTGFIAYRVVINILHKIHQIEDPNYDKVEVLDL